MSTAQPRRHRHKAGSSPARGARATTSRTVYLAFLIIWLFAAVLIYMTLGDPAPTIVTGLVAAFFLYVTLCAARAARGAPLLGWQKGLVRGLLILTGGAGRPIEAIHGTAPAKRAIALSAVLALVAILATIVVARFTL